MSATRVLWVLLAIALAGVFLACGEEKEASETSPSVTARVASASATPSESAATASLATTASAAPVTPLPTEPLTAAPTPPPTAAPTPRPTPVPVAPPPASCHPSYEGACLNPNASDYDCAGGSGNGPYYTGPVRVVGPDVFDLDRDGDGYGCE